MGTVVVFHGKDQPLSLESYADRSPEGAEVLVRIDCCTLCRSDIHSWSGRRPCPVPSVLGHEIVGRIAAFGPEASRMDARGTPCSVGDRISWTVAASCGKCFFCTNGLTQKCQSLRKYGHEQLSEANRYRGGLADQIMLWPGTGWVRLPENIPDEVAALANCSAATAAAALRLAGSLTDQCVVILGAGILGLFACAMAREAGAGCVVVSDPLDANRQRAGSFGATHLLSSHPNDLLTTVHEVTEGRGADVVLELAGTSSAVQSGIDLLRIGGTIILAGTVSTVPTISLNPEQVVRRLLTLRGLHNYHLTDLLAAIDFLSRHEKRYPFASLISASFPLAEAQQAFAYAQEYPGQRVAVHP